MKPLLNNLSIWFGLLMTLLVSAWALALAFTDFMEDRLFGNKRWMFIGVLLAYALYRAYRIYSLWKQSKYND